MLYTKEFFELAKRHLNPGGVVTMFVQLYESNEEAVKSEIATFFDVFPNGVVFAQHDQQRGLRPRAARAGGADQDRRRPVAGEARPAGVPGHRAVAARDRLPDGRSSCSAPTPGSTPDLGGWLKDASINRDRNLRLQYLAGMGFNLRRGRNDLQQHAGLPAPAAGPVLRLAGVDRVALLHDREPADSIGTGLTAQGSRLGHCTRRAGTREAGADRVGRRLRARTGPGHAAATACRRRARRSSARHSPAGASPRSSRCSRTS